MRPVRIIVYDRGQRKEFTSLRKAIEYRNKKMHGEKVEKQVSVGMPTWLKAELKDRKGKYGVSMSAQVLAWLLQGTKTWT